MLQGVARCCEPLPTLNHQGAALLFWDMFPDGNKTDRNALHASCPTCESSPYPSALSLSRRPHSTSLPCTYPPLSPPLPTRPFIRPQCPCTPSPHLPFSPGIQCLESPPLPLLFISPGIQVDGHPMDPHHPVQFPPGVGTLGLWVAEECHHLAGSGALAWLGVSTYRPRR